MMQNFIQTKILQQNDVSKVMNERQNTSSCQKDWNIIMNVQTVVIKFM